MLSIIKIEKLTHPCEFNRKNIPSDLLVQIDFVYLQNLSIIGGSDKKLLTNLKNISIKF